ncbi:hypothetical protein [Oenococcus kitaharae]|uniref:Uncharacterized protein n=1 Tax=Oenococcus kitaharae DSM 17330 TaxID=1045004 RepID=G9WGV6_9LACO|nr:hypothetical protein [Oenococcus kitaharae]EHN59364.1 hypothetical protein OKIT_1281 [Oenococcus kitaharae DSM 17330]OEY83248.1 hypothetical protein NT95_03615 [Oenococcus kitaharae]OEY85046.1 hypothetical protein NT96_00055 [Oenococcus kitaharae]OEY85901.1 hypothetical protein NV75_00005 [Oenococcus kitaharae]
MKSVFLLCVIIASISLVLFVVSGILLILKKFRTVSKIVLFLSPILLIFAVFGGWAANNQYQANLRQARIAREKQDRKAAIKESSSYKADVLASGYLAGSEIEKSGSYIYGKWQNYFNDDNADYNSDGITKVVNAAVSDQSSNLSKAQAKISSIEDDVSKIRLIYDKYPHVTRIASNYSSSKKMLNLLNKFYDNCSNPVGTYNGWTDKYNSLDSDLGNLLKSDY